MQNTGFPSGRRVCVRKVRIPRQLGQPFDALGYLQVDGLCEQLPGGSRRNLAEAETIAAWIADQRARLEQSYPGRTLAEIIGIVTPFAAQVQATRRRMTPFCGTCWRSAGGKCRW